MLIKKTLDSQFCCRLTGEDSFVLFRVRHNSQSRFVWELIGSTKIKNEGFVAVQGVNLSPEIENAVQDYRSKLIALAVDSPRTFAALISIGKLAQHIAQLDSYLSSSEFELLIWAEADLRNAITANKGLELLGNTDVDALILRGNQLLSEGKSAEAEDVLRNALKADPRAHNAQNFLAVSLFRQGKNDDAIVEMQKALELNAGNRGYALRLINFMLTAARTKDASELIKAEAAFKFKHSPEQMIQLSRFAQRVDDADIAYKMASAALETGDASGKDLEHAINTGLNKGGEALALQIVKKHPQTEPMSANLRHWKIRSLIADGALLEAKNVAKAWTKESPKSSQAWFLLGRVFKEMKRPNRATYCLETAIELDAKHAPSFKLLADVYFELGQLDYANVFAQQATALDPENKNIKNLVKNITERLAKLDKSEAGDEHG